MKKLRKSYLALAATLAVLAATVAIAPAREMRIVWNQPNDDADGWQVETRPVGSEVWTATMVDKKELQANFPDQPFEAHVRAFKKVDAGAGEVYSDFSDSIIVPVTPSKPAGVKVVVKVAVEINP